MQVISRRTSYPVDRRAWPNVIGWFGLGVLGLFGMAQDCVKNGPSVVLTYPSAFWIVAVAYLFVMALIIYKLRHPDRLPPSGKFEEVSPDTQARINAAFERRKR